MPVTEDSKPNDLGGFADYKEKYGSMKSKLKAILYENELFQDELRNLQRELLDIYRDKETLLERVIQYEDIDTSSSDSESLQSDNSPSDTSKLTLAQPQQIHISYVQALNQSPTVMETIDPIQKQSTHQEVPTPNQGQCANVSSIAVVTNQSKRVSSDKSKTTSTKTSEPTNNGNKTSDPKPKAPTRKRPKAAPKAPKNGPKVTQNTTQKPNSRNQKSASKNRIQNNNQSQNQNNNGIHSTTSVQPQAPSLTQLQLPNQIPNQPHIHALTQSNHHSQAVDQLKQPQLDVQLQQQQQQLIHQQIQQQMHHQQLQQLQLQQHHQQQHLQTSQPQLIQPQMSQVQLSQPQINQTVIHQQQIQQQVQQQPQQQHQVQVQLQHQQHLQLPMTLFGHVQQPIVDQQVKFVPQIVTSDSSMSGNNMMQPTQTIARQQPQSYNQARQQQSLVQSTALTAEQQLSAEELEQHLESRRMEQAALLLPVWESSVPNEIFSTDSAIKFMAED